MKIQWLELVIIGAIAVVGDFAQAAPMSQAEFSQYIVGTYGDANAQEIQVYEKEGELFLENRIFVGSKTRPATYRVSRFECYNHAVTATTCAFLLELVDMGSFAHFLGVTPNVSVDRFGVNPKLEIQPDFRLAGVEVPWTIVERL